MNRKPDEKQLKKQQAKKLRDYNRGLSDTKDILRLKLKYLKRLPDDFRCLAPGSQCWKDYGWAMGHEKEKEMSAWLRGPILLVGPVTQQEERYFSRNHTSIRILECEQPITLHILDELDKLATEGSFSFIYLPHVDDAIVHGLNMLADNVYSPYRWKSKIRYDDGKALGDF